MHAHGEVLRCWTVLLASDCYRTAYIPAQEISGADQPQGINSGTASARPFY